MSETYLTAAAIALLCIIAIGAYWAQAHRRRLAVSRWALENGFTILELSSATLTEATPFWLTASKGPAIFRVIVATSDGRTRAGWLRIGSWWGGDAPDVRWDG